MKRLSNILAAGLVCLIGVAAANARAADQPRTKKKAGSKTKMSVKKSEFGETENGKKISLYTCTNANGLVMKLTDYGAIVVSLETPDRDGKLANITLGFDSLDGYLQRHP